MWSGDVAVTTNAYSGYELDVALDHVRSLSGCDAVELDAIDGLFAHVDATAVVSAAYRSELAAMVAERGLRCTALSAQIPSIADLDDLHRRRFVAKLELAAELGAGRVNVGAGPAGAEQAFRAQLASLLPLVADLDLTLGLETQTGAALIHDRTAAAIIERIASPRIDVNYDFGNDFFATDGRLDLLADMRSLVEHVGSVHLKDAVRTGDGWAWAPIAGTIVDYAEVFQTLRHARRDIAVSIELPPRMVPGTVELTEQVPTLEAIDDMLAQSISNVSNW